MDFSGSSKYDRNGGLHPKRVVMYCKCQKENYVATTIIRQIFFLTKLHTGWTWNVSVDLVYSAAMCHPGDSNTLGNGVCF